jgi:hypothetical protein
MPSIPDPAEAEENAKPESPKPSEGSAIQQASTGLTPYLFYMRLAGSINSAGVVVCMPILFCFVLLHSR